MILTACEATSPQDTAESDLPALEPIVKEPVKVEPTPDTAIFGTWKTDCLVPDRNSTWAERHTFIITENRSAVHTRESFYEASCSGSGDTATNNYVYAIPSDGKINLTDIEQGFSLYDSYAVSENSLRFGHDFRDKLPYGDAAFGGTTESVRITNLNDYLIYKKQ